MKTKVFLLSFVLTSAFAVAQSTQPPSTAVEAEAPIPRFEDNIRPLSGVQDYDLGTRTEKLNTLSPSLSISESYGTNPGLIVDATNKTTWGSVTNLGGALRLAKGNGPKLFTLDYRGTGQINSYDSDRNTQIHALNFVGQVQSGRWTYVVGDDLSYQPNAYGAYNSLLYPGVGSSISGSDIQPGVTTGNGILSSTGSKQFTSATFGQVNYQLSRKSEITFNGTFNLLNYIEGPYLDTRQYTGTVAYDHRFRRDTLGVSYSYSKLTYSGVDEDFDVNTVHLTYGRRIIGRYSIMLGIGPSFQRTNFTTGSVNNVYVSGEATLRYAGTWAATSISYMRSVTGGSGIVTGAMTDSIAASLDKKLSRNVSMNLGGGYTYNTGHTSTSEFKNFYVSGGISRQVGRYVIVALGYRGQQQFGNATYEEIRSHAAVASLIWNLKPIRLR